MAATTVLDRLHPLSSVSCSQGESHLIYLAQSQPSGTFVPALDVSGYPIQASSVSFPPQRASLVQFPNSRPNNLYLERVVQPRQMMQSYYAPPGTSPQVMMVDASEADLKTGQPYLPSLRAGLTAPHPIRLPLPLEHAYGIDRIAVPRPQLARPLPYDAQPVLQPTEVTNPFDFPLMPAGEVQHSLVMGQDPKAPTGPNSAFKVVKWVFGPLYKPELATLKPEEVPSYPVFNQTSFQDGYKPAKPLCDRSQIGVFRCPVDSCGRMYRRRGDLKVHVIRKHADDPLLPNMISKPRSSRENKPFPCPDPSCRSGFQRRRGLLRHFRLKHIELYIQHRKNTDAKLLAQLDNLPANGKDDDDDDEESGEASSSKGDESSPSLKRARTDSSLEDEQAFKLRRTQDESIKMEEALLLSAFADHSENTSSSSPAAE